MANRILENSIFVDVLEALKNKHLAITGASGYIGAALVDALAKYPSQVVCVSRQELATSSSARNLKADIRTYECWRDIVDQADVIFHLAGTTSIYAAATNPAESLNSTVLPVNHLIRAAQELGRHPRVVFASTATVYGLTEQLPVAETVEPKPITVYDLHKYFAEQQLALATKQGILDGVSLRLANVYGPSARASSALDRGILNRLTSTALQGKEITIYGEGNYVRDYVYIDDVISAFILAGLKVNVGNSVFNVASGQGTCVEEAFRLVAQKVASVTGNQVLVQNSAWPAGASPIEFRNFVANINSISESLGWIPRVSLASGIDCLIKNNLMASQNV